MHGSLQQQVEVIVYHGLHEPNANGHVLDATFSFQSHFFWHKKLSSWSASEQVGSHRQWVIHGWQNDNRSRQSNRTCRASPDVSSLQDVPDQINFHTFLSRITGRSSVIGSTVVCRSLGWNPFVPRWRGQKTKQDRHCRQNLGLLFTTIA